MPAIGHLKVAITSNSLTRVDVAFTLAKQILFYDVSADSAEFIDSVRFAGGGGAAAGGTGGGGTGKGPGAKSGDCWMMDTEGSTSDRLAPRVNAVKGSQVVFTKGLSDLAAVQLFENKVFPVKMEQGRDVDEVISSLQKMMKSALPPLWLRKALGLVEPDPAYQVAPVAEQAA